jgi:hypothetical protein
MAPEWHNYPPPRAGPSDSRSSAAANPRNVPEQAEGREEQAEGREEDRRDKPQMEWVYNSDHTDPVNFGYMFLRPVGTRPTRANAGSSHISVRAPDASSSTTPSTASRPSEERSPPNLISTAPTPDEGYTQPSQSSVRRGSYAHVSTAPPPTPSTQFGPRSQLPSPQARYPASESSYQSSFSQIPYRSSPQHGPSAYPPPQQLTPPPSLQQSVPQLSDPCILRI